jgi:hypothetical protein
VLRGVAAIQRTGSRHRAFGDNEWSEPRGSSSIAGRPSGETKMRSSPKFSKAATVNENCQAPALSSPTRPTVHKIAEQFGWLYGFKPRDEPGDAVLVDRADPDAVMPVRVVVWVRLRVVDRLSDNVLGILPQVTNVDGRMAPHGRASSSS